MDISIHSTMLPHDDPEASLAFYRDSLGFEVRDDVEVRRPCTGSPSARPDQPGTSIVLYPAAATPGLTDDERRTIAELMAKGTFASINPWPPTTSTAPSSGSQATDAEVVQEPTDQPYGIRDCALRDPAGNLVRIQEVR